MAEVLFLGMSQSAPYFSHTCNHSYRGKRGQDNLCKTRPPKRPKKHTVQCVAGKCRIAFYTVPAMLFITL